MNQRSRRSPLPFDQEPKAQTERPDLEEDLMSQYSMLQHRISKFPAVLIKIALEYNRVTLKIEPTRYCEVSSFILRLRPS